MLAPLEYQDLARKSICVSRTCNGPHHFRPNNLVGTASPGHACLGELSIFLEKRAWAQLIKQVYEVDPLVCPRCSSALRIIAFIEQPEVIDLPVPCTADREDPDPPRDLACP